MIYGYIRVSSDKQTVENQRFEIKIITHLSYQQKNVIKFLPIVKLKTKGREQLNLFTP